MSEMQNAHGKVVDQTFLSILNSLYQGMIHRDYMTHCLRWSHALRFLMSSDIRKQGIRVLEIGCGKETPFAIELVSDDEKYKNIDHSAFRLLRSHKLITNTDWYVGVDVTKIKLSDHLSGKASKGKIVVVDETNFADFSVDALQEILGAEEGIDKEKAVLAPNLIICNEVAEHMPYEEWLKVLERIKEHADEDTTIMVSTPNFSGQAAKNHVNEYTFDAFGAILEDNGFGFPLRADPPKDPIYPEQTATIYGTFGQQRKIFPVLKKYLGDEAAEKLLLIKDYFDTSFVSILFAPLFARDSSNTLWEFTKAPAKYKRYFPALDEVEKPWGSGWVDEPFSKKGTVTRKPKAKADKLIKPAVNEALPVADLMAMTTSAELLVALASRGFMTAQAWRPLEGEDDKPTTVGELMADGEIMATHPGVVQIAFESKALVPGQSMSANLQTWAMDLMQYMAQNATVEPEEEANPTPKKAKVNFVVGDLITAAGDHASTVFLNVTDGKQPFIGLLKDCPYLFEKLHNVTGSFVPPGLPIQDGSLLDLHNLMEAK
ncbi:MAG: class I SAM-dependent methyltransferase [Ketobacter sp.]|nr:class I SAM-dependent methyltransferase [Ketobacter sp.]